MNTSSFRLVVLTALLSFIAGIDSARAAPDVSQRPLFTETGQPPLNMLVMGKDTKNYYEAYNDASDLDGDGALDIGYKPASIDYYGYFNSYACYTYDGSKFVPSSATSNKQCSGKWSGDFLNYVTTSRMDALRRVLYGGWRQVDSTTQTILQGAYFPQDGHSWGKEYQSVARDGYDISAYTPLSAPAAGYYHLFAMTTLKGNNNTYASGYQAPVLRVLKNTDKRVWNWVSIEGPVAGNKCFTTSNQRVDCVTSDSTQWDVLTSSWYSGLTITTWKRSSGSGNPSNATGMDSLFSTNAIAGNLCGSGPVSTINTTGGNNNPFVPGAHSCGQDNYLTALTGTLVIPASGTYHFGIDGDDAVELWIDGTRIGGWYGGHANDRSDGGLNSHSWDVTLTAGNHTVLFRHQEAGGDDNWGLFNRSNVAGATRDDYSVRVLSCPAGSSNAGLRESSCKKYPNDQYKPTGILHDYGETSKMYFGLISGSQFDNLQGGVLRRNVGNFADEIDPNTGQFRSDVNGIANTISKLRMIGGGYNSGVTDNTNSDTNWNWANGTGNCPSVGNRAINNGECRMWGNPIAEMMYESMRYFAGAAAATPEFATGGASQGRTEETTMGLSTDTWKDPYTPADEGGGGFLACSKPFETVISDINPSYDGDLPGSAFSGVTAPTGVTPSTISSFNAASEGQAIWNSEFSGGGSRSVFIGESAGVTDGAPTVKLASSFGNIRGLAPEEPTKGGTYYAASVARFARNTDISSAEGQQNLATYAIALASPLPKIEFPVGNGKVTLLPFAKTASGTFGDSATRKPTNTIVDFYVEKIVNLPNQPFDATVNGGRPYAVFRINYEDVEQGNDHDMDAIVRYEISANADNTVTVHLNSEYAAGSANQNMGYVLSGTTKDGVYLEVRDTDSPTCRYSGSCTGGFKPYDLNTPPGRDPGFCVGNTTDECGLLPTENTRTFTPTAGASDAIQLENPLWYAAKYGAPQLDNDDVNGDGVPDNYFLVTNPARLREQLDKAFQDILANAQPTASVATSTPRFVAGSTLAYQASFNATDWTGDLKAFPIDSDGVYIGATQAWSASAEMPSPASRNIVTAKPQGSGFTGVDFTVTGLTAAMQAEVMTGLDPATYDIDGVIAYLRGDHSHEQSAAPPGPYRTRGSNVGDILNSSPAVVAVTSYGYGQSLIDVAPAAAASYSSFVDSKKAIFGNNSENPVVFVGANDGMLHAFDGSEGTNGGRELFAYVPNAALDLIGSLADPSYTHHYFVDGTPTVGDAYLGGWKTILLESTGAGSRSVFALDVTNPGAFSASKVLWEFNNKSSDPDAGLMGQFVGRPWMGLAEGGTWVATFGNGYNNDDNSAVLFVRRLDTGAKIATIKIPASSQCASGEAGCGPDNGLATAVLVDNDGNGAGDTIYAGDYLGNMWRFEYSGGTWSLGNSGQPIFVARDPGGKRQSITSGVYTVANPLGGTMVVFGTGRYLNVDDADSAQIGHGTRASVDTVYGIWDNRSCSNFNTTSHQCTSWSGSTQISTTNPRSDLQQQAITSYSPEVDGGTGYRTATRNPVNFRTSSGSGEMGWYLDLSFTTGSGSSAVDKMAGERVTVRPDGVLSDVVINSVRPEGDSCEPGVQNVTMVLDALTGAADYVPVPPEGGWPAGHEPPPGTVGVDTYRGPPQGEPPIVIITPPPPTVPCDPTADPTCTPTPPDAGAATSCSWVSPNPTDTPPGKPMPCGRISWRQLR